MEHDYGPEERYRVYRKGRGDEDEMVLVCTAPDPASVGTALCVIGREHMKALHEPHPPVGILDGAERKWLISLWPTQ